MLPINERGQTSQRIVSGWWLLLGAGLPAATAVLASTASYGEGHSDDGDDDAEEGSTASA